MKTLIAASLAMLIGAGALSVTTASAEVIGAHVGPVGIGIGVGHHHHHHHCFWHHHHRVCGW